jgi:ABC-type Fe3+ transport system permease subunit
MSQYDPYSGAPTDPASHQQPGSDKKGLSIAALVLGILALPAILTVIGGILLGLIALVLGIVAARGASRGKNGGRGMAITGAVLGVVGIVVSGIIVAVGVSFLNSDTGQDLQDCISQAGDDQTAIDQCQRDLEDDLGGS